MSYHKQDPLFGDYKIVVINTINDLKGRRFTPGPIDFRDMHVKLRELKGLALCLLQLFLSLQLSDRPPYA